MPEQKSELAILAELDALWAQMDAQQRERAQIWLNSKYRPVTVPARTQLDQSYLYQQGIQGQSIGGKQ